MQSLNAKELKSEAVLRMATTPGNHSRLPLVYGAVTLGASILIYLLDLITTLLIENTGGLGDLGTRAILGTINQFFPTVVTLLMPLWMMGLMRSTLRLSRQEQVGPKDLLDGFPRWGVFLRLCLFHGITIFAISYIVMMVVSTLFAFTAAGAGLMEYLAPYMEDPELLEAALNDPATSQALLLKILPFLIVTVVALLVVLIPKIYSIRLSFYRIADDDRPGALISIAQSKRMMRGHRWLLAKLDLSFWWYYLLQVLLAALLELPVYLAGSVIPMRPELLALIAVVVQSLGSLWLYYKFLLKVEVSYALFYDTLLEAHKAPPPPPSFWQQ